VHFLEGVLQSLVGCVLFALPVWFFPRLRDLYYRRNRGALQKRLGTISAEGYVEKMKNRAIHSVSGGLYFMAMGLFFGQASSMMPLSRRGLLAYQCLAMAFYFIAGLAFLRAGAAAYDSRLPVLEKRRKFLKSEIERLAPPTDQVPTITAPSSEAQAVPERQK
jgi:hypothetical protein